MNQDGGAPLSSSASLAHFDPGDAVGPRTELDEEDALALARIVLDNEGPAPLLGCMTSLALLFFAIPGPWGLAASWLAIALGSSSLALTGLRFYRRAIALRGVDLDKKLRKKAYRFAIGRMNRPSIWLARGERAQELLAADIHGRFGARGPSSEK